MHQAHCDHYAKHDFLEHRLVRYFDMDRDFSFSTESSIDYIDFQNFSIFVVGGGGTTRPLPRDGGAEELRGDPAVGPHPKVWTIDRE